MEWLECGRITNTHGVRGKGFRGNETFKRLPPGILCSVNEAGGPTVSGDPLVCVRL